MKHLIGKGFAHYDAKKFVTSLEPFMNGEILGAVYVSNRKMILPNPKP